MKLVLRTRPAKDATLFAKIADSLIKLRLVSNYCHGGVVVGDTVLHSTTKGLHSIEFDPSEWESIDLGEKLDSIVLQRYAKWKGAKYDWFSLLAFVLPGRISDARRLYCFEWCWLALTGITPTYRVTPEMLLRVAIEQRESRNDREV